MGDRFLYRYWEYLSQLWKERDKVEEGEEIPKEKKWEILNFQLSVRRAVHLLESVEYDEKRAWENIDKRIRPKRFLQWKRVVKYAAMISIGCGVGMFAWYFSISESSSIKNWKGAVMDRYPDRIELILANGERILPERLSENRIVQGEVQIEIDTTEKSLNYFAETFSDTVVRYNTLRIPKGAEYSLKLGDGTLIRLNSESSIRFPLNFSGKTRDVYLEGEAFFKVAKDTAVPFHVHSGVADITVLGTEFNVSVYPEDAFWHVTLVEGSVGLNHDGAEALLYPSQQYFLDRKTGKAKVRKVDTGLYTSWVDGIIAFKGERLESIIQKLQRWYPFELFYQNEELKDMRFGGMINKNNSFEVVLKKLERTTNIRFEIKDYTVTAKKIQY